MIRPAARRPRIPKGGVAAGAMLAVLASGPARAAEWRIAPHVEVRETITDNVRATGSEREADFITTGVAGFNARADGRRLRLGLSYDLAYDKYAETTEFDGLRHGLLGVGNVEVVPEHLFIDARGAITERPLRRRGAVAATDRGIDGNTVRVINTGASPYYLHTFGSVATAELRYRFNQVTFTQTSAGGNADLPEDVLSHYGSVLVRSGTDFSRMPWTVEGESMVSTIGDDQRTEHRAMVIPAYRITDAVSVLAGIGYEDVNDPDAGFDSNGMTWLVGARYAPSANTMGLLTFGRRYGELEWHGELRHRLTPGLAFVGNYRVTEGLQQRLLSDRLNELTLDPDQDVIDPDTNLPTDPNRFDLDLADTTVRRKAATATLLGAHGRNRFAASVFHVDRDIGSPDFNEALIGGAVSFGRRINTHLEVDAIFAVTSLYESTADQGTDVTFNGGVGLTYRFNPTLVGSLRYQFRHQSREIGADVTENVIMALVRKEF